MGKHYDKMKTEVGLMDAPENSDEDEEATEQIFKKLRPQSKYKFSEVIKNQGHNMDQKKMNKMIGPMGVALGAQIVPYDNTPQSTFGLRMSKKKTERHRFAEAPENPRAMHNQMMKQSEGVFE